MIQKLFFLFSFSFLVLFFPSGCAVSGESGEVAEEIKIAETVLSNFRQVKVKKGRPLYEVKAEKAETFSKENLMKVYNMEMTQYGKENKIASKGIAERVDFNTDSENAVVSGNMEFKSLTEKVTLRSQWLRWENKEKILMGRDDIPVALEKEGGTHLEGKGFKAVTETKTITFSRGMKGVFVPEKAEDSNNIEEAEAIAEESNEKK